MYNNNAAFLADLRENTSFDWRIYLDNIKREINNSEQQKLFYDFLLTEIQDPSIPKQDLLHFLTTHKTKKSAYTFDYYYEYIIEFITHEENKEYAFEILFYLFYYNHISANDIKKLSANSSDLFLHVVNHTSIDTNLKHAFLTYLNYTFEMHSAHKDLFSHIITHTQYNCIAFLFQKINNAILYIPALKRKKLIQCFMDIFENSLYDDPHFFQKRFILFLDMLYQNMGDKSFIIFKYILTQNIKGDSHHSLIKTTIAFFYEKEKHDMPFDNFLYYLNKAKKNDINNPHYYEQLTDNVITLSIQSQKECILTSVDFPANTDKTKKRI